MLSRALYRFARFEMKSVGGAERSRALELQVRHWAPFANPGSFVLWEKNNALVWAWNAETVASAIAEQGLKLRDVTIIPETVLRPRRSDGAHLVSCMDGFEGQVWHDGALASSRWWQAIPSPADWVTFQRDAGALLRETSSTLPKPAPSEWIDRPWGESAAGASSGDAIARRERWVVPAVGFCLFAATLWYGAQVVKLHHAIAQRGDELAALDRRAEPILAARGQAMEAVAKIEALQAALDRFPDQVTLLSRVAGMLPRDGTYLKQWEFANGKLKVQIASQKEVPTSDWVKRFEGVGTFRNVQVAAGSDATMVQLSMDAVPAAEMTANSTDVRLAAKP